MQATARRRQHVLHRYPPHRHPARPPRHGVMEPGVATTALAVGPLLAPLLAMGAGAIYLLALVLMQPAGAEPRLRRRRIITASGAAALALALAVAIPFTMPL